jgi:hypothetical protein
MFTFRPNHLDQDSPPFSPQKSKRTHFFAHFTLLSISSIHVKLLSFPLFLFALYIILGQERILV